MIENKICKHAHFVICLPLCLIVGGPFMLLKDKTIQAYLIHLRQHSLFVANKTTISLIIGALKPTVTYLFTLLKLTVPISSLAPSNFADEYP